MMIVNNLNKNKIDRAHEEVILSVERAFIIVEILADQTDGMSSVSYTHLTLPTKA